MRYRLDELGWHQFENLCQSLLKAKFADAIESWGGSLDIGRDGINMTRCSTWKSFASAGNLPLYMRTSAGVCVALIALTAALSLIALTMNLSAQSLVAMDKMILFSRLMPSGSFKHSFAVSRISCITGRLSSADFFTRIKQPVENVVELPNRNRFCVALPMQQRGEQLIVRVRLSFRVLDHIADECN